MDLCEVWNAANALLVGVGLLLFLLFLLLTRECFRRR